MTQEEKETLVWNLYADLEEANDKKSDAQATIWKCDDKIIGIEDKLRSFGYDPEEWPFDDGQKLTNP
jgi:hypothetical protein